MKLLNKIYGMACLALMLVAATPKTTLAQGNGEYISTQDFYDELSPYGAWVYDAKYGDVWIPDVDQGFRPYVTNGHWVYTSYGNTWVSDYEWGWATFHYGRWAYDDYYGWEWVPGNEWAPAWVDWREGDGYYGWAPLTPGISFETSFGDDYYLPDTYWSFAPYAYINSPGIYNYCVPYARVRSIYGHSNFIRNTYNYNNRTYITGPKREDIQRYTRRPVRVYTINNVSRPSRNTFDRNSVNFYRPGVRQAGNARPARVIDGAAYRQQNPNQRIGGMDRRNGNVSQPGNAGKLATEVRSANPDSRYVRVNNRAGAANPAANNRPDINNNNQPTGRGQNQRPTANPGQAAQPAGNDRFNRGRNNGTDQNQQQTEQQRQQQTLDQQRQQQQRQQPTEQQRQAREQQRQQRQQQVQQQQSQQQAQQQTEQQRQVQEQQRNEQLQRQQQADQQRQTREQQRQQMQQQRNQQQTDQQKQVQEQQRQQMQQQRNQQRQQQTDEQRQQQQQARQQQMQQQRDQQTQQQQQAQQQRDQQAQQQARDQQRQQQQQDQQRQQQQQQQQQQQDQQRQQQQQQDQQRQQQEQQRQQQEQQRQQQEQQRQQQQQQQQRQQPQNRPGRP